MSKDLIMDMLKMLIVRNIPCSFAGEFHSDNPTYNELIRQYYPVNGVIQIENMSNDKEHYMNDIGTVLKDYKVASKKVLDQKKKTKQLTEE